MCLTIDGCEYGGRDSILAGIVPINAGLNPQSSSSVYPVAIVNAREGYECFREGLKVCSHRERLR